MILAIDPGKTSGWATFGMDGIYRTRGQMGFDEMLRSLSKVEGVKVFVLETYTHDPGRQKRGSTFQTVQLIGAIKLRALQLGAELYVASREAKGMGAIYTGEEPPRDHRLSHEVDAKNIGTYYLVTERGMDPPTMAEL